MLVLLFLLSYIFSLQPAECAALIEQITNCNDEELLTKLKDFKSWSYGKCELYHWCNILDRFDSILEKAAAKHNPDGTKTNTWVMHIDMLEEDSQVRHQFTPVDQCVLVNIIFMPAYI